MVEHVPSPIHGITEATFWKNGIDIVYCEGCKTKLSETVIKATGGCFRFVIVIAATLIIALIICLMVKAKRKTK